MSLLCRTCIHLKGCICQPVSANELPPQGSLENTLLLRALSMTLALLCACTCLAITFSQTPLHLQRLFCSYCPFAMPQGQQDGSHPWGRLVRQGCCASTTLRREGSSGAEGEIHFHTMPHHRQEYSSLRNQDITVIPIAILPPKDLQRTRSNYYTYFFFSPQLKEKQLVEVSQVPSRALSGWCCVQVELQLGIEHGKCRQGDCCGQHR